MVPYADFNLLKFPDKAQAMEKIKDLTCLSDILADRLPRSCYRWRRARVAPCTWRAQVRSAWLARRPAQLLGAAVVIVGDLIPERLAQAKSFGCETVDVSKSASVGDQIAQILKVPEVDCAVDCVGFEAHGHGADAKAEAPATVLNSLMSITRAAAAIGIPGLYVTDDPGAWIRAHRPAT